MYKKTCTTLALLKPTEEQGGSPGAFSSRSLTVVCGVELFGEPCPGEAQSRCAGMGRQHQPGVAQFDWARQIRATSLNQERVWLQTAGGK